MSPLSTVRLGRRKRTARHALFTRNQYGGKCRCGLHNLEILSEKGSTVGFLRLVEGNYDSETKVRHYFESQRMVIQNIVRLLVLIHLYEDTTFASFLPTFLTLVVRLFLWWLVMNNQFRNCCENLNGLLG